MFRTKNSRGVATAVDVDGGAEFVRNYAAEDYDDDDNTFHNDPDSSRSAVNSIEDSEVSDTNEGSSVDTPLISGVEGYFSYTHTKTHTKTLIKQFLHKC